MKRVIIFGNTVSGLAAAEEIRRADTDSEILVFPFDGTAIYYPHLLPSLLATEIKEKAAIWREPAFYEKLKIVFTPQKISRINFSRSRISTEEKQILEYDQLFITDTGLQTKTEVKGDNKMGFYLWPRADVIDATAKTLPLVETVVIMGKTFSCLQLVLALRRAGKEVLWINPEQDILGDLLDGESADMIRRLLEESGVRLFNENTVVEILGDNEVKAIRLKSGKVIASQMVFWGETRPDFRLFKETGLLYEGKISVDSMGRTNVPNVIALGTVASSSEGIDGSFENSFDFWQQEGARAGDGWKGPAVAFSPKATFAIQNTPVRLLGRTAFAEKARLMTKRDETTGAFIKVAVEDHQLRGAVLINAEDSYKRLTQLFDQSSPISTNEEIFGDDSAGPSGLNTTGEGESSLSSAEINIPSLIGNDPLGRGGDLR